MSVILRIILVLLFLSPLNVEANRLYTSGFEMGFSSGRFDLHYSGSSCTLSTTTVRTGTNSLRVNGTAGVSFCGGFIVIVDSDSDAAFYARVYYRAAATPNTFGGHDILRFQNSSGVIIAAVSSNNSSLALDLRDEDGTIADNCITISTDTWYRLELFVDRGTGSSNDSVEFRVDGTTCGSSTTRSWSTGISSVRVGASGANPSGTWDEFFDDFGVNDTNGTAANINDENTWLGDGSVLLVIPDGNGDADSGVTSTGCAGDAVNCLETDPDDATDYGDLTAATSTMDVAVTDISLPANTQVQLVQIHVRFTAEGTGATNYTARIKSQASGTVASTTVSITLAAANVWFTNFDDNASADLPRHTQYKDPQNTALRFTDATLDTMQIGVGGTDGNPDVNITAVVAYVEYESTGDGGTAVKDIIGGTGIIPFPR